MNKYAIALLGKKGWSCLKGLVECDSFAADNITVVVAKDEKVVNDFYEDIALLCRKHNICFFERSTIEDFSQFEFVFVVGWRWLIKGVPNDRLIIFHDSLLPKYRGFAPLVNAAINRDEKVGVTALFGAVQYDRGDIIFQKSIDVTYPIRIGRLIDLAIPLYVSMFVEIFESLAKGHKLLGEAQSESDATYSVWLDEEDYKIDWTDSAVNIANKINMLGQPFKHASAFLSGERIDVISAEPYENLILECLHAGKVLMVDGISPIVICGEGLLKINTLRSPYGEDLLPLKKIRVRFK